MADKVTMMAAGSRSPRWNMLQATRPPTTARANSPRDEMRFILRGGNLTASVWQRSRSADHEKACSCLQAPAIRKCRVRATVPVSEPTPTACHDAERDGTSLAEPGG